MRTWSRAIGDTRCGGCGRQLTREDPVQIIVLAGVKRRAQRCVMCAEGEPPPDLPPAVTDRGEVWRPVGHLRPGPDALPFDYKTAAANDREPGSDG